MRPLTAALIVAFLLPGLASAQQTNRPTHSGRGGQSAVGAGTGAYHTPGDNAVKSGGQQNGKQTGQQTGQQQQGSGNKQ